MKLSRITHDPGELLEFYETGLSALGGLCERTWRARLQMEHVRTQTIEALFVPRSRRWVDAPELT